MRVTRSLIHADFLPIVQCGVTFLDESCMPTTLHSELIPRYVNAATSAGLLAAMRNGLNVIISKDLSQRLSLAGHIAHIFKDVSARARTALRQTFAVEITLTELQPPRGFMGGRAGAPAQPAQKRWTWSLRDAVTDEELHLLSMLPVYEMYSSLTDVADAAAVAAAGPGGAAPSAYRALVGEAAGGPAFLAPAAVPKDVIGANFVKCVTPSDEQLVTALGVPTVTEAEFYLNHFLPGVARLPLRVVSLGAVQVTVL